MAAKRGGTVPLAVIGHASTQEQHDRFEDPTPRYEQVVQWLVRHGYAVVLPVRPGHEPTGGPYLEDQGGCEDADFTKSGLATAVSIEAASDYMRAQSFVKKNQVIVVGQSAGGWGALALASRNTTAVRAVIDFAGGRGGHSLDLPNNNCAADRLVAAAGDFGRTARVATLWLYSQNDSYFGPDLSKKMVDAFRRNGGNAEYHLLEPIADDGHFMMLSSDGIRSWSAIVEKFLAKRR